MRSNKNELQSTFKALGIKRNKSGNFIDTKDPKIGYGTLGILHPKNALKDLSNMKDNVEYVNSFSAIDEKKGYINSKDFLQELPADSYAFDPEQFHSDGTFKYKNMYKNADRRVPNKKYMVKAMRKNIHHAQKSLNGIKSSSSELIKYIHNHNFGNDDYGYGLERLNDSVCKYKANYYNKMRNPVKDGIDKHHIKDLEDIDDNIHEAETIDLDGDEDSDLLTPRESKIEKELSKTPDEYVQVKPHMTGNNDFEPLSNSVVNRIATNTYDFANKNLKYFDHKLNNIHKNINLNGNVQRQQSEQKKDLGIKTPKENHFTIHGGKKFKEQGLSTQNVKRIPKRNPNNLAKGQEKRKYIRSHQGTIH